MSSWTLGTGVAEWLQTVSETPLFAETCDSHGFVPRRPRRRARFTLTRLPNVLSNELRTYALWPWVLRDRENPQYVGRFAEQQDAFDTIDNGLRSEMEQD